VRLTVLGCGDAFGSGGRFNTCFMVETADRAVLLDCGATSLVALRARNLDPNALDGVILTHLHGDHFGGLPFLLLDAQVVSRRERPLTIVGPPGTRDRLTAALEVLYPGASANAWCFELTVSEIVPGVVTNVLGLEVRTAEVIHPSVVPSTAVRLSDGDRVLVYSGDTEWTDALPVIAADADLFIVECSTREGVPKGHLSWVTLEPRLKDFSARRIMLTHMNPSMLAHADAVRAAGLLVASDGLVVDV
jgi:ribonuclease BN (tRNA processing enzyme)